MKIITINAQITRNPKQYEAVRLGMEASIEATENADEAIKALTARLNALYEEMYVAPKKVPQTEEKVPMQPTNEESQPQQKELLKFDDRKLQLIVKRLEAAKGSKVKIDEVLKNVEKYYILDEGARKALDLAVKLN